MTAGTGASAGVAHSPVRPRPAAPFALRRLLVASDGSDAALGALRVAHALAGAGQGRAGDADGGAREPGVAVVAVTEPPAAAGDVPLAAEQLQGQLGARMDRRLALVHAQLSALGERAHAWPVSAPVGAPVDEIVRCACACGADLIVLGLGRHAAADRVLGSEAALHVAERAPLPVLAVPATATGRPRLGVCGVDTDDRHFAASVAAARAAAAILDPAGTLCLARVVAFGNGDAERDGGRARRRLDEVADALRADAAPVRVEVVELRGTPADALLDLAHARGADLLAVGRPGDGVDPADAALPAALFRGAASAVLVAPPATGARRAD